MKYVGIETQKSRNNLRSLLLLLLFPFLVTGLVFLFCYLLVHFSYQGVTPGETAALAKEMFLQVAPYALGGVLLWFLIAYFYHTGIIQKATASHTLSRKENKRVYNLVENLCMSQGMKMPKVNVIDDDSLNAFASGISDSTFTVTLSRGIINKLDDEELEGVIAHELTHIRNRDVRLLIVSIVFVGIFAMLAQVGMRVMSRSYYIPRDRDSKGGAGVILILLLVVVLSAIGYLFSALMRFAISRNREYMADAGAVEMTHKAEPLARALRKISADPDIEAVEREDVAQLFIQHPGKQAHGFLGSFSGLFATHPPIQKRIQILEQF